MEAVGIVSGAAVSFVLADAGRFPANETTGGCMRSVEMLVSGNDWQDSIQTSKQQLSSFMGIGFQLK